MTEYFVVSGKREQFQDLVNTKLAEGWQLYGSAWFDTGNGYHCQGLIREIKISANGRQIKQEEIK